MEKFAKRLKYSRLQRNISVDELAAAIKVNRTTINRYERGGAINSIKMDKLEAIADYLSVSKDYLSGESDNKYNLETLENLSKKQNVEINSIFYMTTEIIKQNNVTYHGKPVKDVDYLIDTLELALEMLKRKNKDT